MHGSSSRSRMPFGPVFLKFNHSGSRWHCTGAVPVYHRQCSISAFVQKFQWCARDTVSPCTCTNFNGSVLLLRIWIPPTFSSNCSKRTSRGNAILFQRRLNISENLRYPAQNVAYHTDSFWSLAAKSWYGTNIISFGSVFQTLPECFKMHPLLQRHIKLGTRRLYCRALSRFLSKRPQFLNWMDNGDNF